MSYTHHALIRITTVSALLLVSAAMPLSADLWEQAVSLFEANQRLVPGRMEITFDQYNGWGRHISSERTVIEISLDESGELDTRILYAEKDGRDVTEERRENPQGGNPFGSGPDDGDDDPDEESPFSGLQKSPFASTEQDAVSYQDTGRREIRGGRLTHLYQYTHAATESAATTGIAWLAADSGAPVAIEATLSPLPGFVDTFSMTQEFAQTDESWYLESMTFDGEGRILFLRRRVESQMAFAEYFPR